MTPEQLAEHRKGVKEAMDSIRNRPETEADLRADDELLHAILASYPELAATKEVDETSANTSTEPDDL